MSTICDDAEDQVSHSKDCLEHLHQNMSNTFKKTQDVINTGIGIRRLQFFFCILPKIINAKFNVDKLKLRHHSFLFFWLITFSFSVDG